MGVSGLILIVGWSVGRLVFIGLMGMNGMNGQLVGWLGGFWGISGLLIGVNTNICTKIKNSSLMRSTPTGLVVRLFYFHRFQPVAIRI